MKVFTIREEHASQGHVLSIYEAKSGAFKIPAILVGERGRGRHLGVLPVGGVSIKEVEDGYILMNASLGKTQAGKPKVFVMPENGHDKAYPSHHIIVWLGHIGFRGSNSIDLPDGTITLVEGIIAQGAAGRMGSGTQGVYMVPYPSKIKVHVGGRLYGAPSEYLYVIEENGIQVFCDDEIDLL